MSFQATGISTFFVRIFFSRLCKIFPFRSFQLLMFKIYKFKGDWIINRSLNYPNYLCCLLCVFWNTKRAFESHEEMRLKYAIRTFTLWYPWDHWAKISCLERDKFFGSSIGQKIGLQRNIANMLIFEKFAIFDFGKIDIFQNLGFFASFENDFSQSWKMSKIFEGF